MDTTRKIIYIKIGKRYRNSKKYCYIEFLDKDMQGVAHKKPPKNKAKFWFIINFGLTRDLIGYRRDEIFESHAFVTLGDFVV